MAKPKAKRKVDVLIVGDSHSVALKAGCDALGVKADILSFSGNLWHEGHIYLHPEHGLWVRGRLNQQRILDLKERLGVKTVLSEDIPIIASAGYHLGRMVPPFGFRKHVTHTDDFIVDPESHFASAALVRSYAAHFRAGHVRFLRRLSRIVPLVAVAPPYVYTTPNYLAFLDAISDMIRAAGVRLYDARDDIGKKGEPLERAYLAEDQVHGNERYGREVIAHMQKQGLLDVPAKA